MKNSAVISSDLKFRYTLTRVTGVERPVRGTALFVMLNPSTADANVDDPTIRRCIGFARSWGCFGLVVVNLYAYRATLPADLKLANYPEGSENNFHLLNELYDHGEVICAWGSNAPIERVARFMEMADRAQCQTKCLGVTKSGQPRHPLYVKADQPVLDFQFKK